MFDLAFAKALVVNDNPTSASAVGTSGWHYVTLVNNVGTNVLVYVDGQLKQTSSFTATYSYGKNLRIGASDSEGYYFTGSIDEVRVSGTARTSGWIGTEYANQNSPGTFLTVGAQKLLTSSSGTHTH
jgi:hypothetical protein